ncbi:MAG: HRDC domain-containing protein, partial [Actinomycetes bacterium]
AELVDEEVAVRPSLDLSALITELRQRADARHPPVVQGVTLASLHAAKGLEWDAVFLCGMHEGTMPIVYADTPAAVEEERRLLYVGMTRARQRLAISWALARTPGGRGSRKPSRFLTGLRPEVRSDRVAEDNPKARKRRGVAHCRVCAKPLKTTAERKVGRCDDCPPSYDEELFERLREWRVEQAAEEKVPAYVIFTDLTLQAIAEVKPTDPQALLRISGIGKVKLDKYGDAVLDLVST